MTNTNAGAASGGDGSGEGQGDLFAKDKAEERAVKAERELRELRAAQKKRDADAERDAMAQRTQDLESAKRTAAELADREKKATAEAEELRGLLKAQTQSKLAGLPKEERARIERYAEKLSLADWTSFVDEEVARHSRTDTGGDAVQGDGTHAGNLAPPATPAGQPPAPPAAPAVARVRDTRGQGRQLNPWTEKVLADLAVPSEAAKQHLEVQRDGVKAKFVYPPQKLVKLLRERAIGPKLLSHENYLKLFGE